MFPKFKNEDKSVVSIHENAKQIRLKGEKRIDDLRNCIEKGRNENPYSKSVNILTQYEKKI